MARKPKGSHRAYKERAQLNYYNKILIELYMHFSI